METGCQVNVAIDKPLPNEIKFGENLTRSHYNSLNYRVILIAPNGTILHASNNLSKAVQTAQSSSIAP